MKGYKAFGEGMVFRGKQYAENTVFEEPEAEVCKAGMHFCKQPIDVLRFYTAAEAKEFAEVEALDEAKTDDGVKYCTKKLRVGAKLSLRDLVKAQVTFVRERCANEQNAIPGKPATAGNRGAATAGDYGAATAGNRGAATAGDRGAATAGNYGTATAGNRGAATAGDRGAATAGDYGAATAGNRGAATAGDRGAATAGNYGAATSRGSASVGANGVGLVRAERPKARGGKGAVLVLAKEDESGEIEHIVQITVDGESVKENSWYTVNADGCAEEVND